MINSARQNGDVKGVPFKRLFVRTRPTHSERSLHIMIVFHFSLQTNVIFYAISAAKRLEGKVISVLSSLPPSNQAELKALAALSAVKAASLSSYDKCLSLTRRLTTGQAAEAVCRVWRRCGPGERRQLRVPLASARAAAEDFIKAVLCLTPRSSLRRSTSQASARAQMVGKSGTLQ